MHVLKLGSTYDHLREHHGDFEDWTAHALGLPRSALNVVDVRAGDPLPSVSECRGIIMTGSHAMVSHREPWSEAVADWLPGIVAAEVPLLGICYGHQLLAHAFGGEVGDHPEGKEIGTVDVALERPATDDPLFSRMPPRFRAHATHTQSVLTLPDAAVHLAGNAFEPHHAFRIGRRAWGVQFHPEYDTELMAAYIDGQAETLEAAGRDLDAIHRTVAPTPEATELLRRFLNRFVAA
ncbi:MAG: glutamine amidotransferase [Thiohalospira sp.]